MHIHSLRLLDRFNYSHFPLQPTPFISNYENENSFIIWVIQYKNISIHQKKFLVGKFFLVYWGHFYTSFYTAELVMGNINLGESWQISRPSLAVI